MKSIFRWPIVCLRCGSLDHMAKDCIMPARYDMSTEERDYEASVRRDKRAVIALAIVLVLAQFVISYFDGVAP